MYEAMSEFERTGQFPEEITSRSYNSLLSFIVLVIRVHQRISAEGKRRIEGILRGGLKDDVGLSWFAHELAVAAHLMSRGFEVNFNDLENGGGFDFLALKDDQSLEIECKHISGDIGRKIHKKAWLNLVNNLHSDISMESIADGEGLLIDIAIPNSLGAGENKPLRDAVLFATKTKTTQNIEEGRVEVHEFDFLASPFGNFSTRQVHRDAVEEFLRVRFAIENPNAALICTPSRKSLILNIRCDRRDTVLKSIVRQLKKSSKDQLTGDSPGVICALLSTITGDELKNIAENAAETEKETGTGLQWATNHILQKRPGVRSIAFMAFGEMQMVNNDIESPDRLSVRHQGHVYEFQNQGHFLKQPSELAVF